MTPDCQAFRAAWLDRFLEGSAPEIPTGHLESCEACRAEIEAWQRSAAAARQWGIAPAPKLQDATILLLRARMERLRQRRSAFQLLALACAASAAVNAATFRLIWAGAGMLRRWLGWPSAAQTGLFAAWAAAPLILIVLLLWLLQAPALMEEFHDG